jgi:hypothetical protein
MLAPERKTMVDESVVQTRAMRGGSSKEILNLMTFLASDEAAYITAQSIILDDGRTLGAVSSVSTILELPDGRA